MVQSEYARTAMGAPRLASEDEAQFLEHMRRSYRKVHNLAFRLSGNKADAEDLTQEAFFRAYRGFKDFEGDRPFENWIFRIVTRLFLDLNRSRKRRVQTVSYDAPLWLDGSDDSVQFETADTKPTPEAELMNGVVSEELEASLNRLTKEQRTLVWLADVEGVPYKELAEMMQAPVGTIRSRLHRAHKQLRSCLEQITKENGRPLCPSAG